MDVIKPKIGLEEFTQILEPVLLEYYDTGNTEEVVVSSYRKLKILQLFCNFKCKEGGVQVLKFYFCRGQSTNWMSMRKCLRFWK